MGYWKMNYSAQHQSLISFVEDGSNEIKEYNVEGDLDYGLKEVPNLGISPIDGIRGRAFVFSSWTRMQKYVLGISKDTK